jgi:hypothetical protein
MKTHTGIIIGRISPAVIEPADEVDELRDGAPGMPLVGFFTGTIFSLPIWAFVGWLAWRFMG